jgi:hypothetical protein
MTAGTATDHRCVWEQAADRLDREQAIPPRSWPLADTDAPVIGTQVAGDHPGLAWVLRRDSTARPANGTDLAKYARQRADAAWAAANGDPYEVLPPSAAQWPRQATNATAWAVPGRNTTLTAAEIAQAEAPAAPPAPATVAALAAVRFGLGPLDPHAEAVAAQFIADHEAEDKRTATVTIPAQAQVTETIPAVTEGEAP